ncbi:DUF2061 domain-containing protein [Zunongwangia sp. F363]|uniref:DUF2061 domain-containing protein n=1 Tax=Autumnicola tepida TaxID=3075595 RepID=A0ABU3C5B6_9FLAO|nr:DUF2061 domain-containing protein [Zunongwangia sp. F363]MDT0641522.1 DUF2061 domain-containing protein [Zunongwangia sp. F363]
MLMFLEKSKEKKSYKKDKTSEKPLRSIAKTISWRIVGTMDTVAISWILTGQIETALAIGSVELVTKMILYFGHERLWNMINFGKE